MEGFTHKQIAEELGIQVSTSRANLVRAKEKLRKALSEQPFADIKIKVNMDEFYNQIRKNLNSRPEPPFDKDAWNKMATLLRQTEGDHGKKYYRILPVVLLLLFLSTGLNGWLLLQSRNVPATPQSDINADAIRPKKVVTLIKDTVFQTRVVYEEKVRYIALPPLTFSFIQSRWIDLYYC